MMEAEQEAAARPTAEPPADVKAIIDDVIIETERKVNEDTLSYAFDRLEKWKSMANALIQATAVPQKKPAEVVTVLMMAHDMGLPQMVALRGMFVINRKVAMETWLLDLVATRMGVTKEVVEETPTKCRIRLHREGFPPIESSFSLEEAKTAGLIRDYDDEGNVTPASGKHVWKSYTKDLLWWRTVSRGLRRIAPDVFGGVYIRDEVAAVEHRGETGQVTDTNAELAALEGA